MLRIAVWDVPPARFLVSRLESEPRVEIVTGSPVQCEQWLASEEVDVALISTLSILRDPEPWELLPEVGLAGRRYPYAQLVLRDGLSAIGRIAIDPTHRQEAMLTQIILKEHYQASPEFVPYDHGSTDARLQKEGGVLVTDPSDVPSSGQSVVLDIGREWFELSTYPMVWGLFAARQDRLPMDRAEKLQAAILAADAEREAWIAAADLSPDIADFMKQDLIAHITGHIEGGLTEFAQYLFFHGVLEEVPQLPFLIFSDEEESSS